MDPKTEAANRLNLNAIKRLDPVVDEIADRASHVVVYKLSRETQGWDKAGIEGALFIARRQGHPQFCLVVLNRLGTENHLTFITSDWKYQIAGESFLTYQLSQQPGNDIYGLWFHSQEDMQRIANLLSNAIITSSKPVAISRERTPPPPATILSSSVGSSYMDAAEAEDQLKQMLFTPKQERVGFTPQQQQQQQQHSLIQSRTPSMLDAASTNDQHQQRLLLSQKRESERALWQLLKTPPPAEQPHQSAMMINGGSFSTPASILSPALQQHQQQIPMFIPPPFYATPAASGSPLITTHQHGRQFRQSSSSSSASFLSTVQQPGSSLLLPSSILNYTQTSNNNNGSVAAPPQSTPVKSSLSNVPLQVLRAKVQQPVGNAGEPPRTPLSRTEFLSMFIEALQNDAEFQDRIYQEYARNSS